MCDTTQIVLAEIKKRLSASPLFVAIDGRCASGKTTLAARLCSLIPCNTLHMDSFFLRPEQRTNERLNMPGGNVDYERFIDEALKPLKQGKRFSYRPYDCHKQQFGEPISVLPQQVSIIEGSYSCHPNLWDYYDLHIFLTIDPKEQSKRILNRNGEEESIRFYKLWIPLEESYFNAYRIEERCELVIQAQP